MWKNRHKPDNMAVEVSAPMTGLRILEDVLEARNARFGPLPGPQCRLATQHSPHGIGERREWH